MSTRFNAFYFRVKIKKVSLRGRSLCDQ